MPKSVLPSLLVLIFIAILSFGNTGNNSSGIDDELTAVLQEHDFTGDIQQQLEEKLGRKLNKKKINLGRLIFFDKGLGLHQDNSCAGCHAPGFGFGDSQPIAIGVDNNDTVGIHRAGPRNQRRTPSVMNTAFYPNLMWNSRFGSFTQDPFDNSMGFEFPPPEGDSLFNILYDYVQQTKHLLIAQAHLPFTELPEMAGFTSTSGLSIAFSRFSGLTNVDEHHDGEITQPLVFLPIKENDHQRTSNCPDPDFSQFDDGDGLPVPPVDPYYNSPNFGIRSAVLDLINNNAAYLQLFKEIYPQVAHSPVDFIMISEVVAEFEFSLTFAKAPLDKFAAGSKGAMTAAEKRGALLFFGRGNCVSCHAVSGTNNQMFSDFEVHNVGTPQIYPLFGLTTGNVPFSDLNCPNKSATGRLDYGREEFTGNMTDRYKFRSSPLRNAKLQSSFFHNGSFNDLKKAIKFHLDPGHNINTYSPVVNGVPSDLHYMPSDMSNVMATLDPAMVAGVGMTAAELEDLYIFVRDGLYDNKADPQKMNKLIPETVPSGVPVAFFENAGSGNQHPVPIVVAENQLVPPIINPLRATLESNPTYTNFSVQLSGDSDTSIRLIVTDFNGRLIEIKNDIQPGDVVHFGEGYQSGFFLAQFIQGKNKISLKLIKL